MSRKELGVMLSTGAENPSPSQPGRRAGVHGGHAQHRSSVRFVNNE